MTSLSLLKKVKQQKKRDQHISNNNITISHRPKISLFKIIHKSENDINSDYDSNNNNNDNSESISECECNLTDNNYPTADFYLENLNTNIYSEKLTINTTIDDIGKYDVKAIIKFPLKKTPFHFAINCEEFDIDKISDLDYIKKIIFMLDSDAFKSLLLSANYKISNAEIDEKNNEHIPYFKDINTCVKLNVANFYPYYIANEVFASPIGESLFNNENLVVNNLTNSIESSYQSKVNMTANYWDKKYNKKLHDKTDEFLFPYKLNNDNDNDNDNENNKNPSQKIFESTLASRPEVLKNIKKYRIGNSKTYRIPFLCGDSISFKVTINPDNTQTTIINSPKIINSLIYLITIIFTE